MLGISGWAGSAGAATAYGSICDTNAQILCLSTTGLDIGNGTCGSWNYRAMIGGSRYYSYYGGCAGTCSGGTTCNGGAGNYYVTTGANGWDFRMLHVFPNASSGSKTCDRCYVGLVGAGSSSTPHTRADNRQYGTRSSAWYGGSASCGASGYCGNIVGYPTL